MDSWQEIFENQRVQVKVFEAIVLIVIKNYDSVSWGVVRRIVTS